MRIEERRSRPLKVGSPGRCSPKCATPEPDLIRELLVAQGEGMGCVDTRDRNNNQQPHNDPLRRPDAEENGEWVEMVVKGGMGTEEEPPLPCEANTHVVLEGGTRPQLLNVGIGTGGADERVDEKGEIRGNKKRKKFKLRSCLIRSCVSH